jgi:DNA gyrase subunit A
MADEDSLIPPDSAPDDDSNDNDPDDSKTDINIASDPTSPDYANSIIPVNIEDEMRTSFLNYSMAVIISRALPDVRDGLKPVQRRILMAMHDLNLTPGAHPRKSAKICGDTSGNYHPHGDAVIYPAMARMAQPFSLRYMLVDGQGNFGSVDGDPPAAMRYTEGRMSPFGVSLLNDLDRETVDWTDNYDQTREEPVVLPAGFPNFLCNGCEGIAVGMATKVPPHNLREVVDGLIQLIDKPSSTIDDLLVHIKGPDFPTAAHILGVKGIRSAYETGRGTITMQAKTQIDISDNGKSQIIITELPFQVNKSKLVELIVELGKLKKVDGITSCYDYSDRTGMRVVVELRRDTYPKKILNFLLKHTPLRMNFSVNMLALVNNQPQLLNLKAALGYYIEHRREVVRRRTLFDLNRLKRSAHLLEGLQIALDVLDEIIALIRRSRTADVARTEMMSRWALSQLQADAILAMQLRQLTSLEREKIETDYKEALKQIAYMEDILTSAVRVNQILKQELRSLRDKHGDERRTRLIPTEADEIGEEDMIPEEETIISITRDGYIKRVDKDTYPTQNRAGRGRKGASIKDEDMIEHLFIATTHHFILFFTDRGRVYRLKAYEVPATSRQAMGTAVVNLINILPGERITAVVPMREYKDTEGFLLFATEAGEVKRTSVSEFKNLRASGLVCFDIEENDALRWVAHTTGDNEVVLVTRKGMSIRFAETDVPTRGRTAGGVRGIRLSAAKEDRVVGMGLVDTVQDLLVISELGLGKRTKLKEYRAQTRGGIGLRTVNLNSKTGDLVDAKVVTADDKLLIMTRNGVTIRINVGDMRVIGRSTTGVKMINLDNGDSVATVERVTAQKDPDAAEDATP